MKTGLKMAACTALALAGVAAHAQLTVTSAAFAAGAVIPNAHAWSGFAGQCSGGNQSPPLDIGNIPAGTQRLAIEMRDTTNPWLHWKVWDIPVGGTSVSLAAGASAAYNATSATNDMGAVGYAGPCPPTNTAHNYVFTVYALTSAVGSGEPSAADLAAVPATHQGALTGVRARNSGGGGGGGGNVAAVPALSEMGIALMGILLAGGAAVHQRRRHRKTADKV